MKNKIITNFPMAIFLLFLGIPLTIFLILFVFFLSRGLICVIGIVVVSILKIALYAVINYISPIAKYDEKTQTISRKGFFFGLKYTIKTNEIVCVTKIRLAFDTEYFVLIDQKHNAFYSYSKRAPIRIPFTEKGRDFIRLFYSKELPKGILG